MRKKNLVIKNKVDSLNDQLSLHDVLKTGYDYAKGRKKGINKLEQQGYILDKSLSNHNHQTYYNKDKNKVLFNVNGTHNAGDWITNLKLGLGIGYKESDRYKQSDKALKAAKQKYNTDAIVSGHSQGGLTANYIASKNDQVITLDKATTIGGKSKGKNYRTEGDLVSVLNNGRKNNINLKNNYQQTGISAIDMYRSHDLDHIKNQNIFI